MKAFKVFSDYPMLTVGVVKLGMATGIVIGGLLYLFGFRTCIF